MPFHNIEAIQVAEVAVLNEVPIKAFWGLPGMGDSVGEKLDAHGKLLILAIFSYYQEPPTTVIFLPWRQLFWAMFHPFSIQIDWSIVSHIVVMLLAAIDALSGGLHMYFLISELLDGTSNS